MQTKDILQLFRIEPKNLADHSSKKWIIHGLIWLSVFLIFILVNQKEKGLWFAITNEAVRIFFYVILVYSNLFYLIPMFLRKQKFVFYIISVAFLIFVISQLKFLVFYFKFTGIPEEQMMLQSQQFYFYALHALLIVFSTIYAISTDWYVQQRNTIELENKNMLTELQFLKSQINPHFLFNTLNNLYALTLKKSDNAPDVVLKLSEIMRYMLYECNESTVPLSKELKYVENYLDLERIRQGERSDIKMTINGDPATHYIAPLIFIPFIENSFKHGINAGVESGHVDISIDINPDELTFNIENSKPKVFNNTFGKRAGGIGLVNVKRRLSLIYPEKHDIIIKNDQNLYNVKLKLDLSN